MHQPTGYGGYGGYGSYGAPNTGGYGGYRGGPSMYSPTPRPATPTTSAYGSYGNARGGSPMQYNFNRGGSPAPNAYGGGTSMQPTGNNQPNSTLQSNPSNANQQGGGQGNMPVLPKAPTMPQVPQIPQNSYQQQQANNLQAQYSPARGGGETQPENASDPGLGMLLVLVLSEVFCFCLYCCVRIVLIH
jgi:hypothetical protein